MGRFTLMLIVALTVLATRTLVVPARAARLGSAARDLVVLAEYQKVATAFTTLAGTSGKMVHVLPLGLFDRAGRRLYATVQVAPNETRLEVIDVRSGRVLASLLLPWTHSTSGGDFSLLPRSARHVPAGRLPGSGSGVPFIPSGSSVPAGLAHPASERWIAGALSALPAGGGEGVWSSILGRSLFMIQPLPGNGPLDYQVRVADTQRGVLDPRPVRAPGERPGSMSGIAWTRVWSPDGSTLYTLYIELNGHAFVHELDVITRRARCLDLPSLHASYDRMVPSALTAAPDGRALYVVNAWLGWAVAIPLGHTAGLMRVVRLANHSGTPTDPRVAAAMTTDGRTMFVTTNHGVWAIDTRTLSVRARYLPGVPFTSVALSPHGRRLYALRTHPTVLYAFDVPSGRLLGFLLLPRFPFSSIQQITYAW